MDVLVLGPVVDAAFVEVVAQFAYFCVAPVEPEYALDVF